MEVSSNDIISACMSLGIMVTMNQRLDAETLSVVADEFGFELDFVKTDIEEEKEEVEMQTMPQRKMRDSNEEKISVNEMKGKRKSEGALPEAKRKKQNDHAPVEAYNFGKKDFKIFGQHKVVEKMKQGQKGKKDKKGERKSAPGAPGFFTEPNFGKMKQKSKAMKNAVKSFTVKK